MTTNPLLATLIPLVADLSRDLPEDERYRRLLHALRDLLPCDATALLRLDGEQLIPLAVDGLSPDTLGRRFRVGEHPRLAALLERRGPTRFPPTAAFPTPTTDWWKASTAIWRSTTASAAHCTSTISPGPADPGTPSTRRASPAPTWTPWKPSPASPPPRSRPASGCAT
ncbi:anaerobic nitric oxide reductase transcription regulator [Pseudomonas aeruginosa]|nr:anaerobic nitric oxide reductase transcription regulator [Pseudomonas aeruginosa]